MSRECWVDKKTNESFCLDAIKTRLEVCSMRPCSGTYGEWTAWSPCSKTCLQSLNETSQRTRSRLCISVDQSLCETGCETGRLEIQICNKVGLCPKIGNLFLKILLHKDLIFCFLDYCPEYKIHALEDDAKSEHHLKMQATFSMTKAKVRKLLKITKCTFLTASSVAIAVLGMAVMLVTTLSRL